LDKRLLRNKRGISPVIATVIIVAVTIAVAIAVAFWMGGLTSIFTRFEKLEITSAYADGAGTPVVFTITLNFKNTGSAAATISDILINGKPVSVTNATSATVTVAAGGTNEFVANPTGTVSCAIGDTGDLIIIATSGSSPWVSGVSVEVTIHTAAGKDYPRVVVLP